MFCSKCGNQIVENEKFCQKCGAVIENSADIPVINRSFIQPPVENQDAEIKEEKENIFSSTYFKMLLIFIIGTAISFVASIFIPFEEVTLITFVFGFLTLVSLLLLIFKYVNPHTKLSKNIDFIIASFALSIYALFLSYVLNSELIKYIFYALMACGFISLFVYICRKIFNK